MSKRDLALDLFRSYKTGFIKKTKVVEERTSQPGDPTLINEVLTDLIAQRDWHLGIAEGTLFSDWQKIVGDEIASHTTPISLVDGRLTIRTSSTAWATQLLLIQGDLLKTISSSAPGALVEEIAIFGPNTPSWKKGLRSVRGAKGPRDTFG